MKHYFLLLVAVIGTALTISADDCPWFGDYPTWGMSTGYNLNADSWEFNLSIFGDTTGADIRWYVYNYDGGSIKDTVRTLCKGSNTVSNCHAATDNTMRNTHLNYVCVVKTPNCPEGIISNPFDVYVATDGDCMTCSGKSLNLQNVSTYTEGNKITLKATFNADGGHHHYIWYHNGVRVGAPEYQVQELTPGVYPAGIPTNVRSIVDYEDDYNTSYLTIPACEVDDQGTWQVQVWDGIDSNGDTCSVWSTIKTMSIDPVTQCPNFNWRIDGEEGLSKPMYPGETHAISVYTTEPNPTEDKMPSPASLTIEAEGITILDTVAVGDTLTVRFQISETAVPGTAINMTALTNAAGIHYRQCTDEQAPTIAEQEKTYLVFDNNNNTHVWSDPENWWPTYDRIPTAADSAVIRKPCQVDITTAQVKNLTFEVAEGVAVIVLPQGALKVFGTLTNPQTGDIVIQSAATGNGALLLAEGNANVPATVQFYAKSKEMNSGAPVWQYMGYPMQDNPLIKDAYPAAKLYKWTNTPNPKEGGNWQRVDSLSGNLQPFNGYCMTEETETLYTFSGLLNNPVTTNVAIPHNDQGEYPNFAFVANSWVAPIDIAALETTDFGAADATVYIMNTGTYAEAIKQQPSMSVDGTALARGQYNAIPVHAASYVAGALKQIPSMQGFFVHSAEETTLTLDYVKAVFAGNATPEPTRAPIRKMPTKIEPQVYGLHVAGFGAEDKVYILAHTDFSSQFDNGWDGYQFKSDRSAVHFAVRSDDGDLSVAAVPQTEGLILNFEGGQDKYYTLTVHCDDTNAEQGLYIWDTKTDVYTPLMNGMQYQFVADKSADRFQIVRSQFTSESVSPEKIMLKGILYIRKGATMFNAQGQKVELN